MSVSARGGGWKNLTLENLILPTDLVVRSSGLTIHGMTTFWEETGSWVALRRVAALGPSSQLYGPEGLIGKFRQRLSYLIL